MSPFTYRKWGGLQRCEPGDWVVKNGRNTYTVASRVFAETYEMLTPGVYQKRIMRVGRRG